jgi:hypothetical protein
LFMKNFSAVIISLWFIWSVITGLCHHGMARPQVSDDG